MGTVGGKLSSGRRLPWIVAGLVVLALSVIVDVPAASAAPSARTDAAAVRSVDARAVPSGGKSDYYGGGHTSPGGGCHDYTPTALGIDKPRARPGETVTVVGIASPGTTVVVSIGRHGEAYRQIGSALVDPSGHFSVPVVIPEDMTSGTATIRVTTPSCPSAGTITIVIEPNEQGSCRDNPGVVRRGEAITWSLFGIAFTQNSRTTLTLVPRFFFGRAFGLYSGPYPASGTVNFTVPRGARDGLYWVVQTGRQRHGHHLWWAKACKVRVHGSVSGGGGSSTTIRPSTTVAPATTTSSYYGTTIAPATTTTINASTTSAASVTTVNSPTTTVGATTTSSYYAETVSSTSIPTEVLGEILERPVATVASASATRSASQTSSGANSLARTGSTVRPFLIAALSLIALGALLTLRSRRR